jgi:hypothetical protein
MNEDDVRSWLGGMEFEVFFKVSEEILCKFRQHFFTSAHQKPASASAFRSILPKSVDPDPDSMNQDP